MSSHIRDINLWESGALKIQWVRDHMPLLAGIEKDFIDTKPFAGMKIAYQGSSLQQQLVKETFGQMSDVDINNVYSDIGAAVEALKSGKVDAVAVAKGNGDAIIANAPNDIAFSGFEFDVDPIYENNVCLIQKGNTALLEKVNAALAKAKEAGYYKVWYEASQIYSSIKTADEIPNSNNAIPDERIASRGLSQIFKNSLNTSGRMR